MNIKEIKESGTNNILKWAISNRANIASDQALRGLIADELSFRVSLSDVNFMELFRLTQTFHEKVHITNEYQLSEDKLASVIKDRFPGTIKNDNDTINISTMVNKVVQSFINMAIQMDTDDDIIHRNAIRLFLPMISRNFNIEIPITFEELINTLNDIEMHEVFNENYPNTLESLVSFGDNNFNRYVNMLFVKYTTPIRYETRYEKYINIIKYSPLKSFDKNPQNKNKLYKFSLLGLSRYDAVSRSDMAYSLFYPDKETTPARLKRILASNGSLKVDFIVSLPIQYMQLLENSFDGTLLQVAYESSVKSIISNGIKYDDFIIPEYDENDDNPVEKERAEKFLNQINNYRVRIAENETSLLSLIQTIMGSDSDIQWIDILSLLPAAFMTNAVIRIDLSNPMLYTKHYDQLLSSMFEEMISVAQGVLNSIKNM